MNSVLLNFSVLMHMTAYDIPTARAKGFYIRKVHVVLEGAIRM